MQICKYSECKARATHKIMMDGQVWDRVCKPHARLIQAQFRLIDGRNQGGV